MEARHNKTVRIGQISGFSAGDITRINKLYQCKICGQLLLNNAGTFTSPNYPALYPKNIVCNWIIRAPYYGQILLKFNSFDIRKTKRCFGDYLVIHDGPGKDASVLLEPSCGKTAPAVMSPGSMMLIRFRTAHSTQAQGFSAKYQFGNTVFYNYIVYIVFAD
uniref:CUB domain-containing protein n=1 Tax=Callorhinchus milii TaxID=7868 RepID=A0A4W3IEA9_CALMI